MAYLLFQYNTKEIDSLLKSMTVLVDSREQENTHITGYLEGKSVSYQKATLATGDYSCMIPRNPEMGIIRDTYLSAAIERKNSIDELASSIREERFEAELIRSQKLEHFHLLIEDSYENLILGNFRSKYNPKALLARLKTFEARYNFSTSFVPKKYAGNYIFHHLYYQARAKLKG